MRRWWSGPQAPLALILAAAAVVFGACGLLDDPPSGGATGSTTTTPALAGLTSTPEPVGTSSTTLVGEETSPSSGPDGSPGSETTLLLRSDLTAAAAVPGPGDADGSARLIITPDGADEICFSLIPVNVAPVAGLHVHEGKAGAEGPTVIDLTTPTTNSTRGCLRIEPPSLARIAANPGDFYAEAHTADPPLIAVRGQLS